ncbi:hypothetical protein [uncultured Chryseobacterium sp.]|uniref:hypothetical protein n=1 Tax=uncultured Chryseobacterium sp. TaxID=259322 RepID=UPI0025D4A737|nr:hypothetical protein [uncultured Chryseobacterium sp.]
MSLGDSFPESFRNEFAKRNIDPGAAILIELPEFNLTYKKYVIFLAKDNIDFAKCGILVINSEINENVNRNPFLKSQHVSIDCARHDFLEIDSFIDCTKIHPQNLQHIIDYIIKNPEKICGNVEKDIMVKVINVLSISPYISKNEKRKYNLI